MARFYFDLHECGHGAVIDEEGLELPDLAAARGEAIRNARAIMSGEILAGKLCLGCAILIRDANRVDVLHVPFTEALMMTAGSSCQ